MGDSVLTVVARRIADSVRHTDLVARIGGDEFVVLLADSTDDHTITQVGDQIRRAVSIPLAGPEPTVTPKLSLGGTTAQAGETPAVVWTARIARSTGPNVAVGIRWRCSTRCWMPLASRIRTLLPSAPADGAHQLP